MLISGDLFNTSSPGIDYIKEATSGLKKLADAKIPVYIIAGSHDFSPSGKTMIDVFSRAGLVINVARGDVSADGKLRLQMTRDEKTSVKICGIIGRKGMLDSSYYDALDLEALEQERGDTIFMFHTLLTEFKPSEFEMMESVPLSSFPKGFRYYAGGHPHFAIHREVAQYGTVAYPGPLFPNTFREIEKLKHGGFYLVTDWKPTWIPLELHAVKTLTFDFSSMPPEQCTAALMKTLGDDLTNTIVTIRAEGVLKEGKPTDISWDIVYDTIISRGGLCCLRNTSKLFAKEYVAIKKQTTQEHELIAEQLGQISSPMQLDVTTVESIMQVFNQEKKEGERVLDFEERIISDASTYFDQTLLQTQKTTHH